MYKHLSCAPFKTKLTTGSGNAGTCEKLHDRSRIRLRQKAGVCVCASGLRFNVAIQWPKHVAIHKLKERRTVVLDCVIYYQTLSSLSEFHA